MRALLAVALLAAVPAPAHAAATDRVVVSAYAVFAPGDQTIDAGDRLTLVNADTLAHDVTAVDAGPGGWPLFKSGLVTKPGDTSRVVGVESLEPGTYQYFCSVHEYMIGTVTVA